MKKLLLLILILILWCSLSSAQVTIGGNVTIGGGVKIGVTAAVVGPSYASNSCHGSGFSETSQTCVMGSNLVAVGDVLVLIIWNNGASAVISASGCGITWNAVGSTVGGAQVFDGTTVNTSACTVTGASTVSGSMSVDTAEYTGTTGVDVSGADTTTAFATTPNPISCHAVTTTDPNDLVVCAVIDTGAGAGTFTAGSGYAINRQTTSFGNATESGVKSVAGSVTPTSTYTVTGNFFTVTVALHI